MVPAEFPAANRAYAVGMGRILDIALACLKRCFRPSKPTKYYRLDLLWVPSLDPGCRILVNLYR